MAIRWTVVTGKCARTSLSHHYFSPDETLCGVKIPALQTLAADDVVIEILDNERVTCRRCLKQTATPNPYVDFQDRLVPEYRG